MSILTALSIAQVRNDLSPYGTRARSVALFQAWRRRHRVRPAVPGEHRWIGVRR